MIDPVASKLARRGPDTVEILRLRIDLALVSPTVTRTILIRATSRLSTLHTAIQCAMGWEDCHLYEFEMNGERYGPLELYDDLDDLGGGKLQSDKKQVGTVFSKGGNMMSYLYDFGDSWHHTITLEERLPPNLQMRRPMCIAGENACPPEDVGGHGGYMNYLEAVLDPLHEEHEEMIEWRGSGFHPSHFSIDAVEARLQRELG